MIQNEIKKFMSLAPLTLPSIINQPKDDETEITEDSAVLYFPFEEKLTLGLVIDHCIEDMELKQLYFCKMKDDGNIQHCCLFPNPSSSPLFFKMNLVTDRLGYLSGVTVTIYDDVELMGQGLEEDLQAHSATSDFVHTYSLGDLLSLFCKL